MTTKELFPPRDGRADIVWKLVRLLEEERNLRTVIVSLCQQPREVTERFRTLVIPWRVSPQGILEGMIRGWPLQVSLYHNKSIQSHLRLALNTWNLDVLIADMARTSLLALGIPARKRILDMDDRLSQRYRLQARVAGRSGGLGQVPHGLSGFLARSGRILQRPILQLEAARLERFEEEICQAFEATVLVSESEARSLESATGRRIHGIPNYIERRDLSGLGPRDRQSILFYGNMSTAHNVDTAVHLVRAIFPRVRSVVPTARLLLAGRHMSEQVARLERLDGVEVSADVPDMTSLLAKSAVLACPIRFGSGIKTKILEALQAGLPVVTTPLGAEGIPQADSCMVIRESDESFADAVIAILLGEFATHAMSTAGRALVERYYARSRVRDLWMALIQDTDY